jgi:excinuclease ABC subunit B
MYADRITGSIARTIGETNRRRLIQKAYNDEHGITPATIKSSIKDLMETVYEKDYVEPFLQAAEPEADFVSLDDLRRKIKTFERDMYRAAEELNFEEAARLRDLVRVLQEKELRCL